MVALRSRRLETLFGVPLDRLAASHVQALVASSTQESFDLDYKRDHYGHTDTDRRKLAGDVAALANTAGGVIVFGITEDEQACAIDAPGVELSDAEVARIRQVVASLVAPIPLFDTLTIPMDPDEDRSAEGEGNPRTGFVVIAVPRSPQAPHAVLVNDALRFPKRNGSTTRYLSEPEVAAAYRARHADQEYQSQRAVEIEREALARLDISDLPWIVVSLIPDLPGEFTISQASYRTFHQDIVNTRATIFGSSTYTRAWTGRRRLLADGTMDQAPHARWAALELHTDGAGVYATSVADLAHRQQWISPPAENEEPPVQLIDDESIVIGILSGLLRLAQHARDRAATGGGVLVRAQLHQSHRHDPRRSGTPAPSPRHAAATPSPNPHTRPRQQQQSTISPSPAQTSWQSPVGWPTN